MNKYVMCPTCREEGRTSTAELTSFSTTLLATPERYDEQGNRIPLPNPNRTTRSFRCSNGHTFDEKEPTP